MVKGAAFDVVMLAYRARQDFEVYQFEVLDLQVALSSESEEQIT